jgi:non-specific serine/threonine protein kinase
VALARAANDRYVIGFVLNALGSVALHHGDLDHAAALHAEGLGYLREIGDRDGMAALLGNLAYGALVRGDPEQAIAPADESLGLYRALGSAHGTANMLGTLGRALLERGDLDRARNLLSEGLLLGREIGNTWYITLALEGLAAVDAAQGRRDHAVRLFAAVEALIEASSVSVHPFQDEGVHLPALRERRLTNLKTTMGAVAFADAWEAGRELSLEQVITDALVTVDPVESAGSVSVSAGSTATFGLTLRELEVLRLLTEGLSDREIADALSISVRTAGNHVQHTMQKLGVESRTAAAVFAVRHDLV